MDYRRWEVERRACSTFHLAWWSVLLSLSGCALFTVPHGRGSPPGPTSPRLLEDGYEDYVGVIHIHTRYSDGAGTYEDIARIANAQALNYLIVTDHNTLRALREGKQGWYGTTLVLIGDEISTRAGHYVALNITQEINRSGRTTQSIIDEVNRQGGFGFIAHPYYKKRRWTDWGVMGFTGVEIYNVAHDTFDENRLRLVLWTLTVPTKPFYQSIIDRPYDPLRKWDELIAQRGRVVGLGASDAHEFRLFGLTFAPYEVLFRISRTHLLIPSTTLTEQGIYDALRAGHVYVSIELLNEAKGFSFMADDGQKVLGIMGDEVTLTPHLQLTASLPKPAQLTLFKDGQPIATTTADVWQMLITAPGVYRLEAVRHHMPWIFSNPIYVRSATPPPSSTVSDASHP